MSEIDTEEVVRLADQIYFIVNNVSADDMPSQLKEVAWQMVNATRGIGGNHEDNQELIDAVLDQIQNDIQNRDLTAIEHLLSFVPEDALIGFLPEEVILDANT